MLLQAVGASAFALSNKIWNENRTYRFGLIAGACFISIVHTSPSGVSGTVNDVYGHVVVWGLSYSAPNTRSSHSLTVVNHKERRSIDFRYEWSHNVTELDEDAAEDLGVPVPANPGAMVAHDSFEAPGPTVKAGKSKSFRSDRHVDLDEEGVRRHQWYHLKTYTALRVVRGPSLEHHKRITFFHR